MAGRPRKTATPAPTPETPKTAKVVLDFESLGEPEDIEADEIRHTRNTKLDRSPVLGWLKDSWDNDTGKAQTLPGQAEADAFVKLLRSGVNRLGYGLRVRQVPNGDGSVRVEYAAVERRTRTTTEAE